MDFTTITFGQVALAFVACAAIRELLLVVTLPDVLVGPGGWLIDTDYDEA